MTHLEPIIQNQIDWSIPTFGEGKRTIGLIKHIQKELLEIEKNPDDLLEWIDVIILAMDGAHRLGYSPDEITQALVNKMRINKNRVYPKVSEDQPSEHIKDDGQ